MDIQLQGKVAAVSGSTKGIGFAIARMLAREGAKVVINGRSEKTVNEAIAKILHEVPAAELVAFPADLSEKSSVDRLAKEVPVVDIVVNNLGIFQPTPFADIPDEEWNRFFQVNVMSGVRLARAYLPKMQAKNWGRIIFISSESAIQTPKDMIHYGMTKTAQLAVSRGMAEVCAGTGITVNAVLPGPTRSDGLEEMAAAHFKGVPFEQFEAIFFEKFRASSLIRRFAATDEVASLVTYLCSPLASATTGAALRVDGGVVQTCF